MKNSPVLVVSNLIKTFPSRSTPSGMINAVNNISFTIHEGEIVGLLGLNGAGKTTTIQMLLSTLTVTSGDITYFGKNFFLHRSRSLQHVGFASSYVSMPPNFTVYHNLMLHGRLYGLYGATLKKRVFEYLDIFDMAHVKDNDIRTLSSGQKTRVMLARAFMTRPKIVLLDEPTASLDPDIAQQVRQFIVKQRRDYNVSVLITSHNMDEMTELCDRVLVMQKGVIIADNTPEALAACVSMVRVKLMLGDGLKRTVAYVEHHKLVYVVEERWIYVQIDEHKIAQFLTDLAHQGVNYIQVAIEKPTLEDYFLTVARGKNGVL